MNNRYFKFAEKFDTLPTYYIEIGVITGDNQRHVYNMSLDKSSGKVSKKKTKQIDEGVTNAQIMFIQENGSPLRHIPKRPVLQMTIDWAKKELVDKTIDKCINIYIDSGFDVNEVEKELNRMCMRMQNYARKIIYSNDGRLAPNAPSVIAAKGDNHPLFDTGQLARSITCQLRKVENISK